MPNALEPLVQHVLKSRFADLSPEVVHAAKTFCLDTLGVCVAGTSAPYAAAVRAVVSG